MTSRRHDDIDPSLMLSGHRVWVSSNRLADPNNSEPLDVSHQTGSKVRSRSDPPEIRPQSGTKQQDLGMDTSVSAKSSTFIHCMDILFGSTACNPDGQMTQIRRGSSGILLLIQYLRKINWKSNGIPLTVATLKLTQLLEEMQHLCSNTVTPTSPTTPTPASPTSSKRSTGEALSDPEEFAPPKRIRSMCNGSASVEDLEDSEDKDEPSPAARTSHKSKRNTIILSSDSEPDSSSQPAKKKRKTGTGPSQATKNGDRIRVTKSSHKSGKTPRSNLMVLGEDGMLSDIEVQPLVAVAESKTDPTADIKKFFGEPLMMKGKRGPELKLHHKCIMSNISWRRPQQTGVIWPSML
ncbi:hypothetical protein B0H10DRAFT_1948133 [Mycena sp. CBHHK59/15]|nr:hypothetical protein B0H10DRAFT_1948133 [Mycena sp. CBHHK59/15]